MILILSGATLLPAAGQISYGGSPLAASARSLSSVPEIRMPGFDLNEYLKSGEPSEQRLKPLLFAKPFTLHLEPQTDGLWEDLPGGGKIWRIALMSPGAHSLNIIFSRYSLKPGVSVFVYNPGYSHVLGAFDHRNNNPSGTLAISPVSGDRIIIELQMEKGVTGYGELVIGQLAHDFTGILGTKDGRFGLSGDCNIDINCNAGEEWQLEKHSVARLFINGTQLCTGVLLNNTSLDGTPYMLTANHCINDSVKAARTVFVFGYESPFCNGSDGSASNSLSGSKLIATQENLDFTLLRINDMPPQSYMPWYAGWNRTGNVPHYSVSIHHPSGDVKKIAIDIDPPETATFGSGYTSNGHWHIDRWEYGTTEFGSSGSPLFDQNGLVKGALTGGDAKCGNAVNDFYCKFSLAWELYGVAAEQLKPWLDPDGTGTQTIQGFNPYGGNDLEALFTVSTNEICAGDNVVFTDFSTGNIDTWYWDFGEGAFPANAVTRGPHIVDYSTGGKRTVSLSVAGPEGSDPNEKELDLAVKSTEIPVAGFSYTQDGMKVEFTDMSEFAAAYYWEFSDQRTSTLKNPSNTYSSDGQYTVKQLVRNRACADTAVQVIMVGPTYAYLEKADSGIRIYPLPANGFITVESDPPFREDAVAELFSLTGSSLVKKTIAAGENITRIELDKFPSGTYLLRITTGNKYHTFKIPLIRQ